MAPETMASEAASSAIRLTGGCQCGAVRYAVRQQPQRPHICHCRMCQKQFGSFFAPLANVDRAKFEVTRGTIARFASSADVRRGFCRDCGTPMTLEDVDAAHLNIAIGTLDDPAAVKPAFQCGNEARLPWFDDLAGLPGRDTTTEGEEPETAAAIAASSRQHPDHDTPNDGPDRWLPADRAPEDADVAPLHDGP